MILTQTPLVIKLEQIMQYIKMAQVQLVIDTKFLLKLKMD